MDSLIKLPNKFYEQLSVRLSLPDCQILDVPGGFITMLPTFDLIYEGPVCCQPSEVESEGALTVYSSAGPLLFSREKKNIVISYLGSIRKLRKYVHVDGGYAYCDCEVVAVSMSNCDCRFSNPDPPMSASLEGESRIGLLSHHSKVCRYGPRQQCLGK